MKMGYEQILSLASKVNTIHNVDDLLREILISSMLLVEGEASSIFLINDDKTQLKIYDAVGPKSETIINTLVPLETSIAGKSFLTREIVIVDDVTQSQDFYQGVDNQSGLETKSLIAVPLVIDEHCLGVFEVMNKKSGETFNGQDVRNLNTLSSFMASSLYNLTLFEDVQLKNNTINELLDALPDGIILFNDQYKITKVNSTVQQMFGLKESDNMQTIQHDCIQLHNIFYEIQNNFEADKTLKVQEFINVLLKPMPLHLSCKVTRLLHEGQDKGGIAIFRDISQDKAETRERSKILALISHELQNPLSDYHKSMNECYDNKESLDPVSMAESVNYAEQLVENLINYSEISNGSLRVQLRPVDLQKAFKEFLEIMQEPLIKDNLHIKHKKIPAQKVVIDPSVFVGVLCSLVKSLLRMCTTKPELNFYFEESNDKVLMNMTCDTKYFKTSLLSKDIFNMETHLAGYFKGKGNKDFDLSFPFAKLAFEALHGEITASTKDKQFLVNMCLVKE